VPALSGSWLWITLGALLGCVILWIVWQVADRFPKNGKPPLELKFDPK
jgi:hypothetical protein